ncbi:FCD domain-containing protein [uncultured Roseobacter sp.]|uniref:FadR/GntR family transcriptional regulator n=1 Tax=uncultured Roseobacter sp. TaxID=114847 RepID=UPI002624FE4C|nr:FCD domain-containing protein [uncultured Roseobacter sp.]
MRYTRATTVLARLRALLHSGELAVGERLPSERALAQQFSCSRETLRRAILVLEQENEVWRHVGQGTFFGPRPGTAPLRENLMVHATSVQELVQARRLIEPAVAAEAARRATVEDVAKLNDCVSAGRTAPDRFACQKADDTFHRTIATVARNPILSSVLTFLSDARRRSKWQTQWDRTYRHLGINEFKDRHSDQHQQIVDAIAEHDPEEAEAKMRTHLEAIIKALQRAPGSPQFLSSD